MIFKEHSEVMQLLYDMAIYYGLAIIIDEVIPNPTDKGYVKISMVFNNIILDKMVAIII